MGSSAPYKPPIYWLEHAPLALVALTAVVGLWLMLSPLSGAGLLPGRSSAGMAFTQPAVVPLIAGSYAVLNPQNSISPDGAFATLQYTTSTVCPPGTINYAAAPTAFCVEPQSNKVFAGWIQYSVPGPSSGFTVTMKDSGTCATISCSPASTIDLHVFVELGSGMNQTNWSYAGTCSVMPGSFANCTYGIPNAKGVLVGRYGGGNFRNDPAVDSIVFSASSSICGNSIVESGEHCDGSNLNGQTCSSFGFSGGTLSCNASCHFDYSACTTSNPTPVCGNGIIESGEHCDGSNLNGQTCSSFGFSGGILFCNASCAYDYSACTTSNNTFYLHDAFELNDGSGALREFIFRSIDATDSTLEFQHINTGFRIQTSLQPDNSFTLTYGGFSYAGKFDPITSSVQFPMSAPWRISEGPFYLGDTVPINDWSGAVFYVTPLSVDNIQKVANLYVGNTPGSNTLSSISYNMRADGNAWFYLTLGGYDYAGKILLGSNGIEIERADDRLPPVSATIAAPITGSTLAAGTTSTSLQITTNKLATCRYSTTNVAYSSMSNSFGTVPSSSHSATIAGLTNGQQYTYYVACADVIGRAMIYNQATTFSVAAPVDTTPPLLSNGTPKGNLSSATKSTTLRLNTNEAATCKYSTAPNTAYASMTNVFSKTSGTLHTTSITGLLDGSFYTYYVRCADSAGNTNTADYPISFFVQQDTTPPTVSISSPKNNTNVTGNYTVTATASDNRGVVGVQFYVDGAKYGTEDLTSPYSKLWFTGNFAKGTHALTAVARDGRSNTATSKTIYVTVK